MQNIGCCIAKAFFGNKNPYSHPTIGLKLSADYLNFIVDRCNQDRIFAVWLFVDLSEFIKQNALRQFRGAQHSKS